MVFVVVVVVFVVVVGCWVVVVVVLTVVAKNVSLRFRVTSKTYYRKITVLIFARVDKGEYFQKSTQHMHLANFSEGFLVSDRTHYFQKLPIAQGYLCKRLQFPLQKSPFSKWSAFFFSIK